MGITDKVFIILITTIEMKCIVWKLLTKYLSMRLFHLKMIQLNSMTLTWDI